MDNNLFKFHKLNDEGQKKAKALQTTFEDCLRRVESYVPDDTRELAIVKTKLEEACFFAKKGMAIQKENQEDVIPY